MIFLLSYTPIFFRASAAMGTVEFTGLEMMFRMACQEQEKGMQITIHGARASVRVQTRLSSLYYGICVCACILRMPFIAGSCNTCDGRVSLIC